MIFLAPCCARALSHKGNWGEGGESVAPSPSALLALVFPKRRG